jgi:hypothetical protein
MIKTVHISIQKDGVRQKILTDNGRSTNPLSFKGGGYVDKIYAWNKNEGGTCIVIPLDIPRTAKDDDTLVFNEGAICLTKEDLDGYQGI